MDVVTEKISFHKPIKLKYSEELERRLYFISNLIENYSILQEENKIIGLELTVSKDVDIEALKEKIETVIEDEILTQKILPPQIVWTAEKKHNVFQEDAFEYLEKNGMAHKMADGLVCFGESMIKLINMLDDKVKKIADSMQAEEYQYPTLITTKALEQCGYYDSFPHMAMFITRLHNDIDTYKDFCDMYEHEHSIQPSLLKMCNNVDYSLPPTMCYHTYHHFKEGNLDNKVVTAKGKSFRYESKYHKTIERLFDFTIREIVFLGTKEFVVDCRKRYMNASFELINKLNLVAHCEVASDPFFCNDSVASKILNQKMLELKYELRMNIEESKTISIASFNFHNQFFGEKFDIKNSQEDTIYTGCVGFGLERFAYAFVCQHGFDINKWSEILEQI